jgi:hypothetical protein
MLNQLKYFFHWAVNLFAPKPEVQAWPFPAPKEDPCCSGEGIKKRKPAVKKATTRKPRPTAKVVAKTTRTKKAK